ncbi:MAG TPA: hypothetical protein VMJ30_08435 [Gemmatimonadales bacterium]|nr:hypothetical protein [Gemmatimonadales bacterium]
MKHRIALFTFGDMNQPVGHEQVQGFVDRLAAVDAAADESADPFARSAPNAETWEHW